MERPARFGEQPGLVREFPKDAGGARREMQHGVDAAAPQRIGGLPDGANAAIDWVNFENVGAAGAINSCARDLAQWVRFQLNRGTHEGARLLGGPQFDELHAPQMVIRPEARSRELAPATTQRSYALGWFIDHYRGEKLLTHSGALDGFRALVVLAPARKLGFVVLVNLGPTNLPQALGNSLVDQLLGLPARDWNTEMLATVARHDAEDKAKKKAREAKRAKDSKPALPLSAYTGTYRAPGYGALNIRLEGNALRAECLTHSVALEHYQFDTFQTHAGPPAQPHPLGEEELVFRLDAEGEVSGVRFLNTEFRRAK